MSAHRKESTPGHLLALSDEVSRLATTLARLSTEAGVATSDEQHNAAADAKIVASDVGAFIRARRLRSRFFEDELFADPAWDMMLELFHAELSQRRVAVSSLCIAAAVPATTALRWLKLMTNKGLFVRRDDPFDGRRIYVELAPDVSRTLRAYFAKVAEARPV